MQPKVKKSGWLTIAVVVLALTGYLVYKYGYLVYQEYDYYVFYDDIHSLQISNPVYINGVEVGEVSHIKLNGGEKVRVTLSIDKETRLPIGTAAVLASNNIRGDKMIFLELGKSPDIYKHKGVILGRYDTSVMDMSDQISPMVESAKYILGTAGRNFSSFNRKLDDGLVEKTQKDIRNIEQSMNNFSSQLESITASTNKVIGSIKKFRQSTNDVAADRQPLNNAIRNTEAQTAKWANTAIDSKLDTLRTTTQTIHKGATELEESDAGKEMLEKGKMYKDVSEAADDVNKGLNKMKENAGE